VYECTAVLLSKRCSHYVFGVRINTKYELLPSAVLAAVVREANSELSTATGAKYSVRSHSLRSVLDLRIAAVPSTALYTQ
jgi:hypothetical protein